MSPLKSNEFEDATPIIGRKTGSYRFYPKGNFGYLGITDSTLNVIV
ncbi:MAG: hypothetical protein ACFE8F_07515 [Promethearchaeota archaeon]